MKSFQLQWAPCWRSAWSEEGNRDVMMWTKHAWPCSSAGPHLLWGPLIFLIFTIVHFQSVPIREVDDLLLLEGRSSQHCLVVLMWLTKFKHKLLKFRAELNSYNTYFRVWAAHVLLVSAAALHTGISREHGLNASRNLCTRSTTCTACARDS